MYVNEKYGQWCHAHKNSKDNPPGFYYVVKCSAYGQMRRETMTIIAENVENLTTTSTMHLLNQPKVSAWMLLKKFFLKLEHRLVLSKNFSFSFEHHRKFLY